MSKKNNRVLAIDLEMSVVREPMYIKRSGLKNEIIQIGAVLIDEKLNIVDTFSTYIHPEHSKVDRYIRELTGITSDMLKDAPNLYDAIKEMALWIGEEPVSVISWGKLDLTQLKKEMKYKGVHINVVEEAFGCWNDFQKTFSTKVGVRRQFSLGGALEMAGIEPEGRAHDGLTDAYNMARLYVYLKKNPKKKIYMKKIITVTLNPALDKTIYLGELNPGGLHRIENTVADPGGKGINVSKALRALGVESLATGIISGQTGDEIVKGLKKSGIVCDFVEELGETRTNTKLVEASGRLTELNESGPVITDKCFESLKKKIKQLSQEETLFVFSGSVPKGLPENVYKILIDIVHNGGGKAILDASGVALSLGLEAKPEYIKPNTDELSELFSKKQKWDETSIKKATAQLVAMGIKNVAVTLGDKGAYYVSKKKMLKSEPVDVNVSSTVGAGDAFVAGMCFGWMKDFDERETFEMAVATSTGAVTTSGTKPADKNTVNELIKKVQIENI